MWADSGVMLIVVGQPFPVDKCQARKPDLYGMVYLTPNSRLWLIGLFCCGHWNVCHSAVTMRQQPR